MIVTIKTKYNEEYTIRLKVEVEAIKWYDPVNDCIYDVEPGLLPLDVKELLDKRLEEVK